MKHFKYLLIVIILSSCGASFSKVKFKNDYIKLTEYTLSEINGVYEIYPNKRYRSIKNQERELPKDSLKYTNLLKELNQKTWFNKLKIDSLISNKEKYFVKLKLIEKKGLKVSLFESNVNIKDTIFEGKLINGMFYLDNKRFEINGIPYLFGGIESDKRRIGLSKQKNLIVNTALDRSGAILLIFGAGYAYNSIYEFKRIE